MINTKSGTSSRWIAVGLICLLAIIVVFMGARGHLWYWSDVGTVMHYDNAPDESFYRINPPYNIWKIQFWTWSFLKIENHAYLALIQDIIWPFFNVLAAGYLATKLTKRALFMVTLTILFLFGIHLLSFNSYLVTPQNWTVSQHMPTLDHPLNKYITQRRLAHFEIYRSPGPQTSLPFLFLLSGFIISIIKDGGIKRYKIGMFAILGLVSSQLYPILTVAALMLTAYMCLGLLAAKRLKELVPYAIILFAMSIGFVLQMMSLQSVATNTMVKTHLPNFAVSEIYSILGLIGFVLAGMFSLGSWRKLSQYDKTLLLFSVCCILTPIITLNQQILTGVMIQPSKWDLPFNYIALILGYASMASLLPKWDFPLFFGRVYSLLTNSLGALVVCGIFALCLHTWTAKQYQTMSYINTRAAAYTLALDAAVEKLKSMDQSIPDYFYMDEMHRDQLVLSRTKNKNLHSTGYAAVLAPGYALDGFEEYESEKLPQNIRWGYTYAARLGYSLDDFQTALQTDATRNRCWPLLGHFVPVFDCTPYISQFRAYDPEALQTPLTKIVKGYDVFLQRLALGQNVPARETAIVMRLAKNEKPEDLTKTRTYWNQKLIHSFKWEFPEEAKSKLNNKYWPTVNVYLQTPLTEQQQLDK